MILLLDKEKDDCAIPPVMVSTKARTTLARPRNGLDAMEERDLFVSALREYKPVLLHDAEKKPGKTFQGHS